MIKLKNICISEVENWYCKTYLNIHGVVSSSVRLACGRFGVRILSVTEHSQ